MHRLNSIVATSLESRRFEQGNLTFVILNATVFVPSRDRLLKVL